MPPHCLQSHARIMQGCSFQHVLQRTAWHSLLPPCLCYHLHVDSCSTDHIHTCSPFYPPLNPQANFLTCTLSCDHRVVDGAVGAQWLQVWGRVKAWV